MNFSKTKNVSEIVDFEAANGKGDSELVESLRFIVKETWDAERKFGLKSLSFFDKDNNQVEDVTLKFNNKLTKKCDNPQERVLKL